MDRYETAVLLSYGVTKPTIDALVEAGCDSLAAILAIPREQVPLIRGADVADIRAAVLLVGRLADAGVSIT